MYIYIYIYILGIPYNAVVSTLMSWILTEYPLPIALFLI